MPYIVPHTLWYTLLQHSIIVVFSNNCAYYNMPCICNQLHGSVCVRYCILTVWPLIVFCPPLSADGNLMVICAGLLLSCVVLFWLELPSNMPHWPW